MPAPRDVRLHQFLPAEPEPAASQPPAPLGGELAPATVTDAIAMANQALAADPRLRAIWVHGELSGLKMHGSGHWYFALKDQDAVLTCAMFRGRNQTVRFSPADGMKVLVRGRLEIYPGRGSFQLIVDEMRHDGAGDLAVRFEQLKASLAAEGLFATSRKRPIPEHPATVGIVTSLQSAALRDMLRVATSRNPGVRLLVAHASVQGENAAAEIATALARLDATDQCDVIIVGRGGGSIEDLWSFNEERVVRAVVACRTPVVSGVGHETDVTLCDLAADVRASTPSNAAEIVVPDADALLEDLDLSEERMRGALGRFVPQQRQRLDDLLERAQEAALRVVAHKREVLDADVRRLDALSPLATLARGFSVVQKDGRVVRSVRKLAQGDDVHIRFTDGAATARVTTTEEATPHDQDPA